MKLMLVCAEHPATLTMLPTASKPNEFKTSSRVPPFDCILDTSLKLPVLSDLALCFCWVKYSAVDFIVNLNNVIELHLA